MRNTKALLLKTFLANLILISFIAFKVQAQPTLLTIRAKAKDAKFVGSSVGSALILVKDAITGEIIARGLTTGSTGNTTAIMKTPVDRYSQLSDEKTAAFKAQIDIDEPKLLTIEAYSPFTNRQAQILTSTQIWLLPGKDIVGDGVVLEIPGFIVDILEPQTHRFMSLPDDKPNVELVANIVMMCGCTISDGGLWDGSQMDVSVLLKRNGQKTGVHQMAMGEKSNIFKTLIPLDEVGNYEAIVMAFDPKTGNTGVDKVNFIIE